MKLIIRDDDLSYYAEPWHLEKVYSRIWDKCPICFSTVPFIFPGHASTHLRDKHKKRLQPIGENKSLVGYLKEKMKERKVVLTLHGYSHKDYGKTHEYERKDYKKLYKEVKEGKEYLEKVFNIKIKTFVAPHDRFSKAAIKAIEANGLNICRCFSPLPRELFFRKAYIQNMVEHSRLFLKYRTERRIDRIHEFGGHKELYSYRVNDINHTNINELISYHKRGILCVTNHYRTSNIKREEVLEYLSSLKNAEPSDLNEIWEDI